jgi:hypothetical protein
VTLLSKAINIQELKKIRWKFEQVNVKLILVGFLWNTLDPVVRFQHQGSEQDSAKMTTGTKNTAIGWSKIADFLTFADKCQTLATLTGR